MSAPRTPGWRISLEADGTFRAALVSSEDVDLYAVSGWSSESTCAQFLALYIVLMISSHQDDAARLLRQYMAKPTSGPPS